MAEPDGATTYEAMDTRDKQAKRGFAVRLASGETLRFKYPDVHLTRVSGDEKIMAVFCYSLNLVLWGRRLDAIADALAGEYVAWLQEFDAQRWQKPADANTPFIEKIEVYLKKDEDGPQPDETQVSAESRLKH